MFVARIYYSEKYNALRVKNTPIERKSSYFGHLITSEVSAREIRSYNLGEYFKRKYFSIREHLIGERLRISRQRTIAESLVSALARSEEHTSELQSLMRISYAVFCLKKKTKSNNTTAKR